MDAKRQAIFDALRDFVAQRPGLEPGNYISGWHDAEGRRAYRAESRSITRDRHQAEELIRAVEWRESITADDILEATRAYSGRLSIKVEPPRYTAETCPGKPCSTECDHVGASWWATVDYCTGQYFPTEYRRAVCAVMAQALWTWTAAHAMPTPVRMANGSETYNGKSAGTWLREHFRREFGRTIADRWFD